MPEAINFEKNTIFDGIPPMSARVILADPPWSFRVWGEQTKKGAGGQYECRDMEWIKALPVRGLADPAGCVLVMWATAPMLPRAVEAMAAWGFTFKSAGAWAKQSKGGGKWAFGTGYIYRSAAEFWLLGTVGKPKPKARNIRNLIVAPVREHSRKPDAMRTMCEAHWEGPYVELFARQRAPGWLAWGNETEKFPMAEAA